MEGDKNEGAGSDDNLFLSPNEVFESIEAGDGSIELLGFVTNIECSKLVSGGSRRVFAFYLNNLHGAKCRVIAWNNEIDLFENLVKTRSVLHIDGAIAAKFKDESYNNTKFKYQIVLKQFTKVTVLQENFEPAVIDLKYEIPRINLADVGPQKHCEIRIQGYVKTCFRTLTYDQNGRITIYGCGSITDLHHKIEIRILEFKECNFLAGQKIEAVGIVNSYKDTIFLTCQDETQITTLEGERIPFFELEKGFRMPAF